MKSSLLICALILGFNWHLSWASSPGGKNEGPAGNSWKAKVIKTLHQKDPPGFEVKLVEQGGSCMYGSHEGQKDQVVTIPFSSKVKVGDVIQIWLYPAGKASLEIPNCN